MAIEMQPGIELQINPTMRAEVVAAANAHITAKNLAESEATVDIAALREHDTMARLVNLAATREGLAAIIAIHGSPQNK